MKPRRPRAEFAVSEWVEAQTKKFVFPDFDTLPRAAQAGGGGGAPTVVLAPANATDLSKGKADILATGAADQEAVNEAIGLATGGRVVVAEGRLDMTGPIVMSPNTQLIGMGADATIIAFDQATGPIITAADNAIVRDLFLVADPGPTTVGIGGGGANRMLIEGVWFGQITTCVELSGDDWTVTKCGDFTLGGAPTYFVRDQIGAARCRVLNNFARGDIDMGPGIIWIVANNSMEGAISADGGEGAVTADNVWIEGAVPAVAQALIDIANHQWLTVTGNVLSELGGSDGIRLDTVTQGLVASNQVTFADISILLSDCVGLAVTGNHMQWPSSHNLFLDGSDDCLVVGNMAVAATSADNYRVAGDRNLLEANTSVPTLGFSTAAHGINVVSGNDNAVYANYLGDASAYGTADFADAGTGTMTAPGANGQFSF